MSTRRKLDWRFFRACEEAHWIRDLAEVPLRTGCGLTFHPNCGRGYAGEMKSRKCAECRAAEREAQGDAWALQLATSAAGGTLERSVA